MYIFSATIALLSCQYCFLLCYYLVSMSGLLDIYTNLLDVSKTEIVREQVISNDVIKEVIRRYLMSRIY